MDKRAVLLRALKLRAREATITQQQITRHDIERILKNIKHFLNWLANAPKLEQIQMILLEVSKSRNKMITEIKTIDDLDNHLNCWKIDLPVYLIKKHKIRV